MPLNLQPVNIDQSPPEGSKIASFVIVWTANNNVPQNVYRINLLQQFHTGQFTKPQAVWIDNSTCPQQLSLKCDETGQVIRVPAFSQGVYPLFSFTSPSFTVTLSSVVSVAADFAGYMTVTSSVFFVNNSLFPYQTILPAYGDNNAYASGSLSVSGPNTGSQKTAIINLPTSDPTDTFILNNIDISVIFVTGGQTAVSLAQVYEGTSAGVVLNPIFARGFFSGSTIQGTVLEFNYQFNPPYVALFNGSGLWVEFDPQFTTGQGPAILYYNASYGIVHVT